MISVIIPSYQSAKTIIQCLDRVLVQSGVEIEVIVVDDGSTDDTLTLLQPFRDRVTIISQDHRGAAAARNAGAKIARGQYLFFCDSDVILEMKALNLLLNSLNKNPDATYAYCPFKFGGRLMNAVQFEALWLKRFNYISTMSLIRREAFPGFDEALKRFQDWDLWLTMLDHNQRGVLCPQPLFQALAKPGISSSQTDRSEAELEVRIKHKLVVPNPWQRILWRLGFWLHTIRTARNLNRF